MAKKLSDATFLMLRIFQIPLLHRNVGMSERQKSVLETVQSTKIINDEHERCSVVSLDFRTSLSS